MKIQAGLHALFAAGLLASAGVSARTITPVPASAWEIGPVINHRNYSPGLSRPSPSRDGWGFAIGPQAEPHYVTFDHGSLLGRKQIRMRFRVEGPDRAVIHGAKCPTGSPSAVTLYFQREGDNWASDGGRWWATFASTPLAGPTGETEIVAPLDANWTSVSTMTAANDPDAFADAKLNAGRIGFTFANCEGIGHGARSTLPVKFVVTRFEVL